VNRKEREMKTKRLLATLVVATMVTVSSAVADAVKRVHCEKGQSLAQALEKARPGDTFLVSGTCRERVVVTTDQITLDGETLDQHALSPHDHENAALTEAGGSATGPVQHGLPPSRTATATGSMVGMVPRSQSTAAPCEIMPLRASSS
jgi:hypothetical protein